MTDQDSEQPGPRYRVTKVAGRRPITLEDLVGAPTVTVETQGHEEHSSGTGVQDERMVLLYEKENRLGPRHRLGVDIDRSGRRNDRGRATCTRRRTSAVIRRC